MRAAYQPSDNTRASFLSHERGYENTQGKNRGKTSKDSGQGGQETPCYLATACSRQRMRSLAQRNQADTPPRESSLC